MSLLPPSKPLRMVLLFFIMMSFCQLVFSQQPQPGGPRPSGTEQPVIRGTVKDVNHKAIPYASIVIYSQKDSSMVAGAASDDHGHFRIPVRPGSYFARITFLSYEQKVIGDIQVTGKGFDLGLIELKEESLSLLEVEISGEKSQTQLSLDKRVFNVGKDIATTGGSVSDVLERVPSITVDIDGNVSLRGSQNVRILIDGKPSNLSDPSALRMLPGNTIERVEVITNPSARYDAEGEAGIINLITRRQKQAGLNAGIELTTGYPENFGASLNLNYRSKWANLYANYGINYRKSPGKGYSLREFSGDTNYTYEQTREQTRGGLSNNLRMGSDFYLNDKNILTLSGTFRIADEQNKSKNIYTDFDSLGAVTSTTYRNEDEKEDRINIDANLGYRKLFSQRGREWNTQLQWRIGDDTEKGDIIETITGSGNAAMPARTRNTEDEMNWLLQSDYIHPFNKSGKIETGLKATLRNIWNDYLVEEQDSLGNWVVNPIFDNNLKYTENIDAAYIIFSHKPGSFSYQAGLRAEYSDITTELTKTKEKNHRSYLSLFPSIHLSLAIDSSNTLQLSYSRRLNRPRYRDLLPFYSYGDSRNFFTGNPNLDPEINNSFELGYLNTWKRGSVLSSGYYRYKTGVFERITVVDSAGTTRFFPINLSTQHAFGIEFNINYQPLEWWRLTSNLNFFTASTKGTYEGTKLESNTNSFNGRAISNMTLFRRLELQLSADYVAPRNTTQGKVKAMYWIDAGLSTDILKKKATITLSVRDILNSRKRKFITDTEGLHAINEFQWHSRQILLSFIYRFNQTKKKSDTRRQDSMDSMDEMGF
ncbi:MAG: TonB-dependent receptor [Bacteroidetes bacterium]|nr:TonB-dependent receptor [Bacteroidota bacterium]